MFVTDGGAYTDPDFILKLIAYLNGQLHNEVVILTYGIGNGKLEKYARSIGSQNLSSELIYETSVNIYCNHR